jgi:polyphenol oxidase
MSESELELIKPEWPAPANVKAVITTRKGGFSQAPYDSFNLADHVGDDSEAVAKNRALLKQALQLEHEPVWLKQTHSDKVVDAAHYVAGDEADACFTSEPNKPCVVLTADCLPILICNKQGTWVQAIHAGWQGIAHRVVEASIVAYPGQKTELMAYFGPAIGPDHFEVQNDVLDACTADLTSAQKKIFIKKCFRPIEGKEGYFLCNIYELARQRLHKCGVQDIYDGAYCTYRESEWFYSYRRDCAGGEKKTGRMASLIWLT